LRTAGDGGPDGIGAAISRSSGDNCDDNCDISGEHVSPCASITDVTANAIRSLFRDHIGTWIDAPYAAAASELVRGAQQMGR
jgi:hypothetical protein